MVRLVALYKRPTDPAAFDKYYETVHKPLASKIPHLREYRTSKVFGGATGKSEYYFMAELCFDNKEEFKIGLSSPESNAAGKDVDNFAKGLVDIFFIEDAPVLV